MTTTERIQEQRIIREFVETMLSIRRHSPPMANLSRNGLIAIAKAATEQYAAMWVQEQDEATFVKYVIDDLPSEVEYSV